MNIATKPLPKTSVAYSYPAGTFQVQKWTAALFIENPRGYCINELGTGKTRSVLFAYDYLRSLGKVQRMIVLCPLTAMRRTWYREVLLFFPHLKAKILHAPNRAARERKLLEKVDIYITNHDGLEILKEALEHRDDIDCVCVDEIGGYRNGRAEKTKVLREFVRTKDYVWGLTGSPIPRAVTDVWGPCSCLTPHTVPKFFTIFRDQLMLKKGPVQMGGETGRRDEGSIVYAAIRALQAVGCNGVTRAGNQILSSGLDAQAELCL